MERVLLHWRTAPFSDKLQCLFYGRRLNCFRYGHHFGPVVLDGHPSVLEGHRVTLFCIDHWPSRHDAHGIRAPIRCRQVRRVKLSLIKRQTLQTDNSNTRHQYITYFIIGVVGVLVCAMWILYNSFWGWHWFGLDLKTVVCCRFCIGNH